MSSQSGVASSVELRILAIWKSAPSAVPPNQSWTFDLFKSGMCHRTWQRRRCNGSLVELEIRNPQFQAGTSGFSLLLFHLTPTLMIGINGRSIQTKHFLSELLQRSQVSEESWRGICRACPCGRPIGYCWRCFRGI